MKKILVLLLIVSTNVTVSQSVEERKQRVENGLTLPTIFPATIK